MCRFVAYLGKKPVVLNEIIDFPENSLINQSRRAREGNFGLNADGFGIGWYDHMIDDEPGIYKSIQPAWNDSNLKHIAAKVRSTCFLGHVRASTIGDVSTANSHPFYYNQFSFVHNGTIQGIDLIRRQLLNSLSDQRFRLLKGQTDSELFFALLMDILYCKTHQFDLDTIARSFLDAIEKINYLKKDKPQDITRLNTVLTDGKKLIATRYISNVEQKSLSLYYAVGDYIDTTKRQGIMCQSYHSTGALLIASEPLTDSAKEWNEIPLNHMLLVDEKLNINIKPMGLVDS